jgi:hypothetical protein
MIALWPRSEEAEARRYIRPRLLPVVLNLLAQLLIL